MSKFMRSHPYAVLLILSLLFLEKDNFEKFEPGSPARRKPAA